LDLMVSYGSDLKSVTEQKAPMGRMALKGHHSL
jgi:hypothetical protein